MKIVCITNWIYPVNGEFIYPLTKDKIYEVMQDEDDFWYIINDYGRNDVYPKTNFKTISELRDDKLNILINE